MPETKNTRRAPKNALTQDTKIAPSKPKPAATRELTDFQLLACNLAGDLPMNGGRRPDVENLLFALVGHEWFLKFNEPPKSAEYHSAQVDRWYNRLSKDWPEKREPVDALPGTVSGKIYANVRNDLRSRLRSVHGGLANARTLLVAECSAALRYLQPRRDI